MVALLAGLLLSRANGGCAGMERSELQCEEAVARILDCCNVSDLPGVECSHFQDACGGEVHPELDIAESRCVRDATCGELEARGVCAWAAALVGAGYDTTPPPSACP
ncbi:MAG TPA: hypothetical protein VLT61_03060 [Anaeromyxobacteraceae bacterium]|nr:hypothetical protein [Anaeromyxobacteraceae bacterium]